MDERKGKERVEISLVAPMYNEAGAIEKNLAGLVKVLEDLRVSWEIIVVDDGSLDDGAARVRAMGLKDERIRLVSYSPNRGRGYALRQGFARAAGRYVISTESDLTWGADIVAKLYQPLSRQGWDMVVASPYLPGGGLRNVPPLRHFVSWLGNKILCFSVGGVVTMASGMTRGYRAEVIKGLDLEANDKEIHLEILSKVLTLGYSVGEVPAVLTWEKGEAKQRGKRSTFKLKKFVASHLLFSFEEYPFMLFGSLGGLLLLMGAVLGFAALASSLQGKPVGNRPITLGSVLLILFGLQIILFSFLSLQNRKLTKKVIRMAAVLKNLAGKDEEPSER